MDQLVNAVMQKTGMPREQAEQAVNTVLGFLKERLPAPIAPASRVPGASRRARVSHAQPTNTAAPDCTEI